MQRRDLSFVPEGDVVCPCVALLRVQWLKQTDKEPSRQADTKTMLPPTNNNATAKAVIIRGDRFFFATRAKSGCHLWRPFFLI